MNDFENALYHLISSSGQMEYIKKLVYDYLNIDNTIASLRNTINANIEKIREQREIFGAVGQLDYVKDVADKEITRLVNEQKNLNDKIVAERINNQKIYEQIGKFYSEFKHAIFDRTALNDSFVQNRKENEELNSQLELAMEDYNEFFKDLDEFASMGVGFNSIPEVARVIELKQKIAKNDEQYKKLSETNGQQLKFLNQLNNMSLDDFVKFVNLNMINNIIYLDDGEGLENDSVEEQTVSNDNNDRNNNSIVDDEINNSAPLEPVVGNNASGNNTNNDSSNDSSDSGNSSSASGEDDNEVSDTNDDNADEPEEEIDEEETEVNDYGEEVTPDPENFERESGFKAFLSRNKKKIIAGVMAVAIGLGSFFAYKGVASHFKNKAIKDNVSDSTLEESENVISTNSSSDIADQEMTVDGQDYTLGFNVNNHLHDEPRRVVTPSLEDTNIVISGNSNSASDVASEVSDNEVVVTDEIATADEGVANDVTIGSKVIVEDGNNIYSNIYDAYYNQNAKVPYFGAGERTVIGVSLVNKDGNIITVYASDKNYNDLIAYYKDSGYDVAGYLTSNRNVDVNNMDLTSVCQNAEGFYSADSFVQGRGISR